MAGAHLAHPAGVGDHAGRHRNAHARARGHDRAQLGLDVERPLRARDGRQRAAGHRRLARAALRSAAHTHCARSWRSFAAPTRGERVAFKGQIYELPLPGGEGKRCGRARKPAPQHPDLPRHALPRGLELTGEIADGWLGTSFMPDHARIFFEHIEAGAKRAGARLASSICRRAAPSRSATTSSGLVAARKPGLAFTLGRWARASTTSTTTPSSARANADAALEVQRLWLDGKRDEAAARVPDAIALKANLLGTEAMVRERLAVLSRQRAHHAARGSVRPVAGGAPEEPRRLMDLVKSA